jgi:hypothetical protein
LATQCSVAGGLEAGGSVRKRPGDHLGAAGPALEASATITRFDTGKTPGTPLVCARDLGPAERTAFAYFGSIRISSDSQTCGWLLRGSTAGSPSGRDADDVRWERVWQGGRRIDPAERFTLYRRAP